MRFCNDCGGTKPPEEWHRSRQPYCAQCMRKRNRENQWKKQGIDMTYDRYLELVDKANGCCEICKKPSPGRELAVDHDPSSGKIRGLLCVSCNTAIGKLRHSVRLMLQAILYCLERAS